MAEQQNLLRDLRLQLVDQRWRPRFRLAEQLRRAPRPAGQGSAARNDFATLGGRDNLGQAVLLRLLTPRGELAPLGQPGYGSRLAELVGQPNSATVRDLARLYILESLAAEPRIEAVERISVEPHPLQRDRVDISLAVRPVAAADIVSIGPFTLKF